MSALGSSLPLVAAGVNCLPSRPPSSAYLLLLQAVRRRSTIVDPPPFAATLALPSRQASARGGKAPPGHAPSSSPALLVRRIPTPPRHWRCRRLRAVRGSAAAVEDGTAPPAAAAAAAAETQAAAAPALRGVSCAGAQGAAAAAAQQAEAEKPPPLRAGAAWRPGEGAPHAPPARRDRHACAGEDRAAGRLSVHGKSPAGDGCSVSERQAVARAIEQREMRAEGREREASSAPGACT